LKCTPALQVDGVEHAWSAGDAAEATKHAPGAHVHITVEGTAGDELQVSVHNSPATTTTTQLPASGFGLLGIAERITLAGGKLSHHPTPDDGYVLTAQLPWPNHDHEERS
ncbi:sensor histidine kinase, partial [Streptomyces decoyicus]|uniref:sensor histidine kinase n=1 Tax=Streptomyces decoyicus TaxID=249567 RepID=UPI003473C280